MNDFDKRFHDAVNARAETVEVSLPPGTVERCRDALARLLASFGVSPCVEEER